MFCARSDLGGATVPDPIFSGDIGNLSNLIAAVGALGTAAFGLVDATKAWHWGRNWRGGISNVGFSVLKGAFAPFVTALQSVYRHDPLETIHANWINGVATADQKAAAKGLIRLGLTPASANALAAATGIDPVLLNAAAVRIAAGDPPTPTDLNIFGRFDALLSAILDAAYERADQQYRNACKALALLFSVLMSWAAFFCLAAQSACTAPATGCFQPDFWLATLIGIVATPLAPVAKDAVSTLQAAAAALSATKP
jgi:hypothetical protein